MRHPMPCGDQRVNFCMPNQRQAIRTITHRRMLSIQYEPVTAAEILKSLIDSRPLLSPAARPLPPAKLCERIFKLRTRATHLLAKALPSS